MHCFLIAAVTADGFIARNSSHTSTEWTSPEDKIWFGERTKQARAIVMGANTFATIGRPLPGRLTIVYNREPQTSDSPNLRYTNQDPVELIAGLEQEGYTELAICGGASIYTLFMKAGVVDRIYLTLESVLFGQGLTLFTEELDQKLELVDARPLNPQTQLIEYSVISANHQS